MCYNENVREYFEILGLTENSSYEEVKDARIRLLKKYHPDLFIGSKKFAQLKTSEINEAFDALSKYFMSEEGEEHKIKKEQAKALEVARIEEDLAKEKKIQRTQRREANKKNGKNWLDIAILILLVLSIILVIVLVL